LAILVLRDFWVWGGVIFSFREFGFGERFLGGFCVKQLAIFCLSG
jgi:hypothetical protein